MRDRALCGDLPLRSVLQVGERLVERVLFAQRVLAQSRVGAARVGQRVVRMLRPPLLGRGRRVGRDARELRLQLGEQRLLFTAVQTPRVLRRDGRALLRRVFASSKQQRLLLSAKRRKKHTFSRLEKEHI